ncbi:MAG: GTP-binding protein, partial [bacterium]
VKPVVSVIFAGPQGSGKSTLAGRILYERGAVDEGDFSRMKRHARALGRGGTGAFAFITDTTLESRERGLTVEASVHDLETERRRFYFIDAPGHAGYVKHAASGAAAADAAVAAFDAAETARSGVSAEGREHLVLLGAMGVGRVVFAMTKMDACGYSSEVYDGAREAVERALSELGLREWQGAAYVPVSGAEGDGVTCAPAKAGWGGGRGLVGELEALEAPERDEGGRFRMTIMRTFNMPGEGIVVSGQVVSGRVRVGDAVCIAPYPGQAVARAEVGSIEWRRRAKDGASAGEFAGVLLTNLEAGLAARKIKKGFVAGGADSPPAEAERFRARIRVVDHPSRIHEGYTPYLHCHQAAVPCALSGFEDVREAFTGKPLANEGYLRPGVEAAVWAAPAAPLAIESASEFPRLGRFVLRDGRTVAVGECVEVVPRFAR